MVRMGVASISVWFNNKTRASHLKKSDIMMLVWKPKSSKRLFAKGP